MNRKEQQRVMVLNRVERRELTGKEAATLAGLSVRHVRRLLAAYRKEGVRLRRAQGRLFPLSLWERGKKSRLSRPVGTNPLPSRQVGMDSP